MTKLRLALASALDRHGFLSDDDVDARRSSAPKGERDGLTMARHAQDAGTAQSGGECDGQPRTREAEAVSNKEDSTGREERLRLAIEAAGLELRKQADGMYQIVFLSTLARTDLAYGDDFTLDELERWVDENVPKEEQ